MKRFAQWFWALPPRKGGIEAVCMLMFCVLCLGIFVTWVFEKAGIISDKYSILLILLIFFGGTISCLKVLKKYR